MAQNDGKSGPQDRGGKPAPRTAAMVRADRLAAELRSNLIRRKEKSRGTGAAGRAGDAGGPDDGTGSG